MKYLFAILTTFFMAGCNSKAMKEIEIKVDASVIMHTMRGGMGASWHAICKDFPLNNDNYIIPVREVAPRGSAYGGNPPVANKNAWKQIKEHASWLGLNFIRVELSQRMYEPEKYTFDWNNEEMLALCEILDWAQENDVDVFLQQMWMDTEWNALPGIHPLISAPKNVEDFTDGIATLLKYLSRKGYTCIKYFCIANEPPGGTWGYWWEYGENEGSIENVWLQLGAELERQNINIPISGPDWTDMPPFEKDKLGFAKVFGAIDIHSYHGITQEGEDNLRKWANWAHDQDKPFFLTEFGNMNLGWGEDNPAPKSFAAAISNANDVLRGLRAGVDGFNRWSFTNLGDLDGQWQLVTTWDRDKKQYLDIVMPENEAYYGFAIISRFLSKYSSAVLCETEAADSTLMSAALISPAGELSIIMLNPGTENKTINLRISSFESKTLNLYQVTKEMVTLPGFELNPVDTFKVSNKIKLVLPPRSISNLTSNSIKHMEKGIIIN